MRGVVMHEAGDVRVEEREDPKLVDPTDAVIRLTSTCICGSDLWPYRGVEPADHQVMGHEYMGVVEQIGSDVSGLQVGDHVIGSFVISDNTCEICRSGYQSKCVHAEFVAQTIGTQAEVVAFIAAKRREGKAVKSVLNYLGLLHSIFVFAEKRGLATGNPVKMVDKPERQAADPDIRFLDEAELDALLEAVRNDAKGPTERCLYLTAAMTCLRQGELLGLRWRDVDWPAARIRVRQSYVRGEFGTPKSRRSSRSVPLADRVAGELERHFQRSSFQADDDLVFCHPGTGTPLDRSRLLKRFKAAAKRAGIREVRFHDLRHTFGTRMAGAGVALRTLQEWMGHRDFKTTLIYADYQPSAGEADLVERAFGRGVEREEGPDGAGILGAIGERDQDGPAPG